MRRARKIQSSPDCKERFLRIDAAIIPLKEHFSSLDDPRTQPRIEHLLLDIVLVTICAVICGADNWVEIEHHGNSKQEWLETFLELPNGIPSHDTFERMFARLRPEQVRQVSAFERPE